MKQPIQAKIPRTLSEDNNQPESDLQTHYKPTFRNKMEWMVCFSATSQPNLFLLMAYTVNSRLLSCLLGHEKQTNLGVWTLCNAKSCTTPWWSRYRSSSWTCGRCTLENTKTEECVACGTRRKGKLRGRCFFFGARNTMTIGNKHQRRKKTRVLPYFDRRNRNCDCFILFSGCFVSDCT